MKKDRKKLRLNRETLRQVAGSGLIPTAICPPPTTICLPTHNTCQACTLTCPYWNSCGPYPCQTEVLCK